MNACVFIVLLLLFYHQIVFAVDLNGFNYNVDNSKESHSSSKLQSSSSSSSSSSSGTSKRINLELAALNSDLNTYQKVNNPESMDKYSPKLFQIDLSALENPTLLSYEKYPLEDLSFLRGERSNEVIDEDYFINDFPNKMSSPRTSLLEEKMNVANLYHPTDDANDMDNHLYPQSYPPPMHHHSLSSNALPYHLSTGNDALSDFLEEISKEMEPNPWNKSPYYQTMAHYHHHLPDIYDQMANGEHFLIKRMPLSSLSWYNNFLNKGLPSHHLHRVGSKPMNRLLFPPKKVISQNPMAILSARKHDKSMLIRRLKKNLASYLANNRKKIFYPINEKKSSHYQSLTRLPSSSSSSSSSASSLLSSSSDSTNKSSMKTK